MLKIAVVVADFNTEITRGLLASAQTVIRSGGQAEVSEVIHVPGAFEVAMAAKLIAFQKNPPDAIVCLGAIIQGQTDQNTYLAQSCFSALGMLQLESNIPIGLGIISAPSLSVAMERTRGELDRGREAAEAAILMAGLKQKYIKPASEASLSHQAGFRI